MPPKKNKQPAVPVLTPAQIAAQQAAEIASQQTLPPKEALLFKQLLKFYEQKQYKKAIKCADTILKRLPNNGETLAMRGLVCNQMNKKEEAHSLVKKGLASNIKSHVCWHVYGLLYRSERKYDDAIKCYQNALKRDKENQQILKDLANLQVQRRMFTGFTETRRQILLLQVNKKHNWLAYAIGQHLCNNYAQALDILDKYEQTEVEENKANNNNEKKALNYEDSEWKLYRYYILIESGDINRALTYLNSIETEVTDKVYWREQKAELHFKLNQPNESEKYYRELLKINPDNHSYHKGLIKTLGLQPINNTTNEYTPETMTKLLELYNELAKQYPKAQSPKRLPLDFSTGDKFVELVGTYMKEYIRKGIPSLFADLSALYSNKDKAKVFDNLINTYITNLREGNRFTTAEAKDSESPSALLWALYFAGQHYDHLGEYERGIQVVDDAIAHTPTTIDLYVLKARLFKHAGDPQTGYYYMESARKMDTQDRYLNVKTVRYALRADKQSEAESTVQLFLRDGDGLHALYDMQVQWYELTSGEMHMRLKQYNKSLKKYFSIEKHFEDMYEDQFDFHTYCLRKMTLRAYVQMLQWVSQLRSHRFYFKAACNVIKIYLKLYDAPFEKAKQDADQQADTNLSEEEKKQLIKQQKKAAAKERKQENKVSEDEAKRKADVNAKKPKREGEIEDKDPEGLELLKLDPLTESTRWLKELLFYSPQEIKTHLYAIQIYLRKQKSLLVLRSIKKLKLMEPNNHELHTGICQFLSAFKSNESTMNSNVKAVIETECKAIDIDISKPVHQLNNEFIKKNENSLIHRLAGAKVLYTLDSRANRARIIELLSTNLSSASYSLKDGVEVLNWLNDIIKDDNAVQTFKSDANKRYKFALAFGAQPQIPNEDKPDQPEQ